MPMVIVTDEFKGDLLELIGKTAVEAVKGLAPPARIVEGGGFERLVWEETVKSTEDGREFAIRPVARLFQGRVEEVGIQAEDYLFILEEPEAGGRYFAAVPKQEPFEPAQINWVAAGEGGFYNRGVE